MSTTYRWTIHVLRTLLGALFAFSGFNHFAHVWQPPAPVAEAARAFMQGLGASGFVLPVISVIFLVAGLLLLANRWVPFALLLLAAPVVAIFGYHAVSEREGFGIHWIVLAVYLVLAWDRRAAFAPLFAGPARKGRTHTLFNPAL
jgi:uncharacterized membrane protein YphA (DoxX/SURF4 family)